MYYRAVIFDMDGVLIDSEYLYLSRLHREMKENYPWIQERDLYPMVGMDNERTRLFIHQLARKEVEDESFDREMEKIYKKTGEVYFPDILYPEVPGVLHELRQKGYRLALASSSPVKAIKKMLFECGLEKYFDSVISGDQFSESKPNPEIYLTSMEAIGCRPQECLIVEDSTYGVEAGAAAGATVAARLDKRFPFDQSRADYYIHNLKELPGLLGKCIYEEKK